MSYPMGGLKTRLALRSRRNSDNHLVGTIQYRQKPGQCSATRIPGTWAGHRVAPERFSGGVCARTGVL